LRIVVSGKTQEQMPRAKTRLYSILIMVLIALPASFTAQKEDKDIEKAAAANLPDVIWRSPGNMASLNLFYGAGGRGHAPDRRDTFTFVKEDLEATSPKFDIEDARGVQWRVKLGQEPESETAATRFLWAAGYFVDEDYYLTELTVKGLPTLHRGENFVSADGVVHRARLERKPKEMKKVGTWDWFDNPFLGTRHLNGLRVMMSLLNNWDLAQTNNSIEEVGGKRRYVVADVGATFGNTGNSLTRSKSVPKDYADSIFIEHTNSAYIDFVLHSRPLFLSAINVPNYRDRTRMEEVTKHIPRADARWLGHRLSMLSGNQIRDGFRAAGYTPEEIELYTQTMRKRIAALGAL
jgi:hypothetical protein